MIEHLLAARGASQADLARGTGIPRSTISEALKGKRSLSVSAV
jgi:transcriptional regulator with XRE-family HTH domain